MSLYKVNTDEFKFTELTTRPEMSIISIIPVNEYEKFSETNELNGFDKIDNSRSLGNFSSTCEEFTLESGCEGKELTESSSVGR